MKWTPSCSKPPAGWCCTRPAGHEGPCAALPTRPAPSRPDEKCITLALLLAILFGSLVANFGYQTWREHPDFLAAAERTFFQGGALLVVWLAARKPQKRETLDATDPDQRSTTDPELE